MNTIELLDLISTGETSTVQFKETLPNPESMSREIVAMSNGIGGVILLGIEDGTGHVKGLTSEQVEYADRKVAEFADNVKPTVYLSTEVVKIEEDKIIKNILVIHIQKGINKPYKTPQGEIYIKQGSNKRLLTDNAEIMRLFQDSRNLLADEMEIFDTTIEDIDLDAFSNYFKNDFGISIKEKGLTLVQALKAKRVLRNNQLTLAGLLFFGKSPQNIKPAFTIKVVSFFGNNLEGSEFRSKPEDLSGTIPELFKKSLSFLKSNLHHLQVEQSFNSNGKLEISEIALEELIQNALLHRDYFKNSPIRLMIFDNRIEIISPGKLPNGLTVEEIKYGNPVIRNNKLVAFGAHLLPFSGLGTGVRRALENQPDIKFINDVSGEQFIVKIPRPEKA